MDRYEKAGALVTVAVYIALLLEKYGVFLWQCCIFHSSAGIPNTLIHLPQGTALGLQLPADIRRKCSVTVWQKKCFQLRPSDRSHPPSRMKPLLHQWRSPALKWL
ncbi:hypothetical protein SRHO_G00085550 [Serrasalmus rhombeus]